MMDPVYAMCSLFLGLVSLPYGPIYTRFGDLHVSKRYLVRSSSRGSVNVATYMVVY